MQNIVHRNVGLTRYHPAGKAWTNWLELAYPVMKPLFLSRLTADELSQ